MVFKGKMSGGWTRPMPMNLDLEIDRGDNQTKLKDHQSNINVLRVLLGHWWHIGRKIIWIS